MKKQITTLLLTATIATVSTPTIANASTCNVQKHESIWRIAKEYHLDFAKLLELNRHLKDLDLIHPGDKINTHADSGRGNDHAPSNGANDDSGNATHDNTTTSERDASTAQAQEILRLVNLERSKQGLKPLTLNNDLNKVATVKAKDMAQNKYFSHDSPTYGSPFEMMRSFGINDYRSAGENIAAGQRSAAAVMESWMNSSGHRANILNPNYNQLGVGYFAGGSYGTYWVQEFAQR